MPVGSFISVGRSLDQAIERVRRAEELGYDSAYVTHITARDSLSVLMAYASATERIRLGTGVLPIYSRHPVATAQQTATIDEFSNGRAVLGIGVSHRIAVENWYSQTIDKPIREMREYATTCRALFAGEETPQGGRWSNHFRFAGYEVRPEIPIYISALSPMMLRLAGEIGDGVILWLCNPDYIRDVVVPEVTAGRERAGKSLEGFDIVAAVPSAVTDDPDGVKNTQRKDLIPYFSLPFYRAMIERSGFGEDVAGFDKGMADGDTAAAIGSISDRYLDSLCAIGTTDEALASVQNYRDSGATSPCIGPIPRSDFDATLAGIAPLAGK